MIAYHRLHRSHLSSGTGQSSFSASLIVLLRGADTVAHGHQEPPESNTARWNKPAGKFSYGITYLLDFDSES